MKTTAPCGSVAFEQRFLGFLDFAQGPRALRGACRFHQEGLKCFNRTLHRLCPSSPAMTMDQIVNAAERALSQHREGATPAFVQSRMAALERLELLAADPAWDTRPAVQRQIAILRQYRHETGDLIPDPQPVIGLLDDAVLVEVALQLLRDELAIYEDFCRFRRLAADFAGMGESATGLTRDRWLATMLQVPAGSGNAGPPWKTACPPDLRAILFQVA